MGVQEDVARLNQKGQQALKIGRPNEAEAYFRKALALQPSYANLHFNLGLALEALGRLREAIDSFRASHEIDPNAPAPISRLGRNLVLVERPDEALFYLRRAQELEGEKPGTLLSLGHALLGIGHLDEAEAVARKATELNAGSYSAPLLLARTLQQQGKFDRALEMFELSLKLDPSKTPSYFGIAYSKRISEQDRPFLAQTHTLLSQLPPRNVADLIALRYALGKSYDDLGDYASAIEHFDEANRLEEQKRIRNGFVFHPDRYHEHNDWIANTFDAAMLDRYKPLASESDMPVFIVGMIRSGTTLVEQILSSHRDIGGAGELSYWREHALPILKALSNGSPDQENLSALPREYLQELTHKFPGKKRVTDKMPTNYMALGLIHMLFPRARIIHCRRNPADTCLSIYVTPYRKGPEFAHNRANITAGYREYQRLMEHWKSLIPSNVLLEIDYEDLVSNRERTTRQMIEFLGLNWDESCLSPESNARPVDTPSQWQVRKPVYGSSVGRWQNYRPWLLEFEKLLD